MDDRAENELGRLILKLSNTILKNRNRHLEALGLTAAQADALQFFLSREESDITDLKDYLEITHQTARGIVRRMAAKGWVALERSGADARRQLVRPTEAGITLGRQLMRNRERTGGKLLERMTDGEREAFLRLAGIAYENVKND